ncbi:MAG: hypothetical protein KatS3mg071_1690 [Meiothermus sp.]|nr:MAG: hypothetical protein KatS3mg071_1690 [Meiothermus sp.]
MEIFDRLKAKGILEARVGFRGKNGDINLTHVRCYPDFREEEEGRKKVHCDNQTRQALEDLAWEALLESQADFREEGAFGQVVFNVEGRALEVVVHQRHVFTFVESFRLQDGRLVEG